MKALKLERFTPDRFTHIEMFCDSLSRGKKWKNLMSVELRYREGTSLSGGPHGDLILENMRCGQCRETNIFFYPVFMLPKITHTLVVNLKDNFASQESRNDAKLLEV